MSILSPSEENVAKAARSAEAAYATIVIVAGTLLGFLSVFYGLSIPNTEMLLVATLLFGIIEAPRIRGVGEFAKLALLLALTINAIVYVYSVDPDLVGSASAIALVLLFISTLIVALVEEGSAGTSRPTTEIAGEYAPYFAVIGGSGLLALI